MSCTCAFKSFARCLSGKCSFTWTEFIIYIKLALQQSGEHALYCLYILETPSAMTSGHTRSKNILN